MAGTLAGVAGSWLSQNCHLQMAFPEWQCLCSHISSGLLEWVLQETTQKQKASQALALGILTCHPDASHWPTKSLGLALIQEEGNQTASQWWEEQNLSIFNRPQPFFLGFRLQHVVDVSQYGHLESGSPQMKETGQSFTSELKATHMPTFQTQPYCLHSCCCVGVWWHWPLFHRLIESGTQ